MRDEHEQSGELVESCEEQRLRVLLAIHGGVADDLLPGVGPFLDQDLFDRPAPAEWVSRG